MNVFYYDLETFWSVEHSLSKMNPILYCMHQETELQSMAYAIDDGPVYVVFGEEAIRAAFASVDLSQYMLVAHNGSGFDHLIASWRLGLRPKAWGCTLAMAKPFYGVTVGGSLKKVAEAMGLDKEFGGKGSIDEVNTKGKKLRDFTPDEIAKMRTYNGTDTVLCRGIFKGLLPKLPMREMRLIDLAIRMTVEPKLEADIILLEDALQEEINRKNFALLELAAVAGVHQPGMTPDTSIAATRSIVMSQPQFQGLLEKLGVDVPMKQSKTAIDPATGMPKLIPALAKTDEGLQNLLDYEDPDGDEDRAQVVRVAAACRLEVKSTQLETRLRTYALVAKCLGGKLPMPVNYCGAAVTWRYSGAMKMNVQNNPRVNPKKPKPSDALRQSILAPDGKVVVVVDSSNIELRVAHTLAGQMDTVAELKNGEDLYCWFASDLFGRPIVKDVDDDERFIGKVAMLSLQYGASWKAFQAMARILSDGKTLLGDEECKRIVAVWRSKFRAIADRRSGIWKKCDDAITQMFLGEMAALDEWGLIHTTKDMLITPGCRWLQYPDLRKVMNSSAKDEWRYGQGRNQSRIHGAHLFENICQHIANTIVMEQTLKLDKEYPVALSCHDEAVMVVDEGEGDNCKAAALEIFSASPKWWPELPLAAEAGVGYDYAEAK